MSGEISEALLPDGRLSDQQVEVLLTRVNKMVRKLLSNDLAESHRASSINPYGGKLAQLQGRIFLLQDFRVECQRIRELTSGSKQVFLEICSGSGGHLISQAMHNKEAMFFGVELRLKRTVRTIEKAINEAADNVYMLRTDAELVSNIFAPQSLDGVWVNFPDPWAKEKEQKHRVLSAKFLQRMSWLLKYDGCICVRTDHAGYFDDFLKIAQDDSRYRVAELSRDFHASEFAEGSMRTEFESLFLSQGLPIYYLKLKLRHGDSK
jgi:tRNA (guanine-N7-)-methyltransferase